MDKIIELIASNSIVSLIAAGSIGVVAITGTIVFLVAFLQGRRISLGPIQIEEKSKLLLTGNKNEQANHESKRVMSLPDKWIGSWEFLVGTPRPYSQERLFIMEQLHEKNGLRLKGYITVDIEPGKRWDFEGIYSGKFLQLFYYPSDKAEDGLFLDYGCYFFEIKNDGHFDGYSIACEEDDVISVTKHIMRAVKPPPKTS